MKILSTLSHAALPILLAGSLAGCGDSDKPAGENTSGAAPQEEPSEAQEMGSLAKALAERAAKSAGKTPPEAKAIFEKSAKELVASMPLSSMKDVGDTAPNFTLPGATGDSVSLAALLKDGPVVLSFYRGKW